MRRAIVYDWIDSFGGAERLLQTIFDAYPKADIYTLFTNYKRAHWAVSYRHRIHASFLQYPYALIPSKPLLVPFMPLATESLNLDSYDHVLSITSSFAKGICTTTPHTSYVFAPTRFLWNSENYLHGNRIVQPLVRALRNWDMRASTRPTNIYTLSQLSKKAIHERYRRNAEVIYPPFDTRYFTKVKKHVRKYNNIPRQFFLFVGRIEPYKRVGMLIDIFKERTAHVVIVGTGTCLSALKKKAKGAKNITFLSHVTDLELAYLYQKAQATLMIQHEDFGYVALESLFFETPVITIAQSGAAEIVHICGGGIVCKKQDVRMFGNIIDIFHTLSYTINHRKIEMFDKEVFLSTLGKAI